MKQLVRYFSLGLITAGIVMLVGVYFTEKNNAEELSVDQMIPRLEDEGYHVLDNKEYISMTINTGEDKELEKETQEEEDKKEDSEAPELDKGDQDEKEDSKEESKEEDKKEEQEESAKTVVINVESGMHTSSISDLLEENKIIKESSEFNEYLIDNDYHLKVQLGEVEVSSDMSFYELAEALTN
ncbi:endolytic transglycosylase MltG [Oceanobacillus halophilus]|uniref:endolytic transglycosylase MltG n=1 Tax=Oceanobacillus halophilus TaxID=930130 RepID=UPI001F4D558E|nr:endolytic transglycosylase MltG [Oceanobacillus halophilus]